MERDIISKNKEGKHLFPSNKITNRRVLFFAAVLFTIGVLLGARFSLPAVLCFVLSGLFLLAGVLCRKQAYRGMLLLLFVLFLGIGAAGICFNPGYPDLDLAKKYTVEGRVVHKTQKESYAIYKLSDVRVMGESLSGQVFLTSQNTEYSIDDILQAEVKLTIPNRAQYDGGFDDYQYCRTQNVLYRARANTDSKIGEAGDLIAYINKLRGKVNEKLDLLFKGQSGLAKALVTGDEEDILEGTKEIFSLSGLSHILSISGSHVVMMAVGLTYFLRRFRAGRRTSFAIRQVFILFYAAFTGFRVSILRAALMYEVDMTGQFLGLKRDPLTFLSVAYLAIVIPFPAQIFDLGLQLSFGAVFSILCLAPVFAKQIKIKWKSVSTVVAAGLGANIELFPIIINTNNSLWLPGILLNVIATLYSMFLIPVISIITLLYLLLGSYVSILGAVGDLLVGILVWMARIPALLPGLILYIKDIHPLICIFWFAVIFLCSEKVFIRLKAKCLAAAVTAGVLFIYLLLPANMGGQIRLEFLDSTGMCAILYTEEGSTVLIGSSANRNLYDYILDKGIDFNQSFVIMKDKNSVEEIAALSSIGKEGSIYASKSVSRVLKNKYAISADTIEPGEMVLSKRCVLEFIYRSIDYKKNSPVGILLKVDGESICLFLTEYIEEIPESAMECHILSYCRGAEVDLFEKISCDYGIVSVQRRGMAISYEQKGFSCHIINTYESGKVCVCIGRDMTVETMYESG